MPALTLAPRRPVAVVLALSSAFAVAAASSRAAAEDQTPRCISEHEQSQALRRAGKLREARTTLLRCASQECPALVRADCGTWVGEVEASLPSVVIAARDAATGLDVVDARVLIDGEPAAERLDVKAVQVDPGVHTVRVIRVGSPPLERQVVMREGERNRLVSFVFGSAPATSPAPAAALEGTARSRTLPLVFGGIGALGLASFTIFAVSGRERYDHDLSNCALVKGGCLPGEIDAVRTQLIVADASLGVAVVSLGLAAFFWFSAPSAKRSALVASPLGWSGRF
jgi:hypothetical protein